jgi:hypothetical protein
MGGGSLNYLRRSAATISLLLSLELLRRYWRTRAKGHQLQSQTNGSGEFKRDSTTIDDKRRQALLTEYKEISNNFRMLTDVRFKILGLLPVVSGAAVAALMPEKPIPIGVKILLSIFGFTATIGLITYNMRNDQLYDALIGRAALIERMLGLPDGAFANRPRPWLSLRLPWKWRVDHRTGVGTIYVASVTLWLILLFSELLQLVGSYNYRDLFKNLYSDVRPFYSAVGLLIHSVAVQWIYPSALALAIIVTCLGMWLIKRQRERRQKSMRALAADAVKSAAAANRGATFDFSSIVHINQFIDTGEQRGTIAKRADFYLSNRAARKTYAASESSEHAAAQFVADLIDLPPGWLYDCATNRRGAL